MICVRLNQLFHQAIFLNLNPNKEMQGKPLVIHLIFYSRNHSCEEHLYNIETEPPKTATVFP